MSMTSRTGVLSLSALLVLMMMCCALLHVLGYCELGL